MEHPTSTRLPQTVPAMVNFTLYSEGEVRKRKFEVERVSVRKKMKKK